MGTPKLTVFALTLRVTIRFVARNLWWIHCQTHPQLHKENSPGTSWHRSGGQKSSSREPPSPSCRPLRAPSEAWRLGVGGSARPPPPPTVFCTLDSPWPCLPLSLPRLPELPTLLTSLRGSGGWGASAQCQDAPDLRGCVRITAQCPDVSCCLRLQVLHSLKF